MRAGCPNTIIMPRRDTSIDLKQPPTAYEWAVKNSFSMVQLLEFFTTLNLQFSRSYFNKKEYIVKAMFAKGAEEFLLKKLDAACPELLQRITTRTTSVRAEGTNEDSIRTAQHQAR